jgi:nonsense-mediated mRNA decay protein 3
VLDLEVVSSKVGSSEDTMCGIKYVLADVHVVRKSDFGMNDTIFSSRTHLGNHLKPGDHVLGYDLYRANRNDTEYDKHKGHIPEVILIKKIDEKKRCRKPSSWRSLSMEFDDEVGGYYDSELQELLKDFETSEELLVEECNIEE